jgi:hypothetical protein
MSHFPDKTEISLFVLGLLSDGLSRTKAKLRESVLLKWCLPEAGQSPEVLAHDLCRLLDEVLQDGESVGRLKIGGDRSQPNFTEVTAVSME